MLLTYAVRPEATEFGEITQDQGHALRHSALFEVTDFGNNRKLIYDFLLAINTNLPILHHFRDKFSFSLR